LLESFSGAGAAGAALAADGCVGFGWGWRKLTWWNGDGDGDGNGDGGGVGVGRREGAIVELVGGWWGWSFGRLGRQVMYGGLDRGVLLLR
jgi:hypothetical protein